MRRASDGAEVFWHELCHDLQRAEDTSRTDAQRAERVTKVRRAHSARCA